ncbi:hypothetical protein ACFE04_022970 [Oxalis oulophora]
MISSSSKLSLMVMVMVMFMFVFVFGVRGWTGEIRGRVVCDVCGDSSVGPEDHVLQGKLISWSIDDMPVWYRFSPEIALPQSAEVAVLCITKSGEVLNYQAFTDTKGMYTVAETMPESNRWDSCLARPISSFHEHCSHLGEGSSGLKFKYSHSSGYHHAVRPFVYRHNNVPSYCF